MSRIINIRLPLLKAAVIQTASLAVMVSIVLMFGAILAGNLSGSLNILAFFLGSLVLGLYISLPLSLPSLLESLIKFPIKENFSEFSNNAALVILASLIFFLISLAFSKVNPFLHVNTTTEAIFDALFMTALFAALNLMLRLPWLQDKDSTS